MKLKHFIYSICLASIAMVSCQNDEELGNIVDLSSPYVLDYLENSTDEIDIRRYEIYQTYGVAVFLNDKVKEVEIGTDYKGDPIYRNEMLDLGWEFYSKDQTTYEFSYLFSEYNDEGLSEEEKAELEELKEQELKDAHLALDYAETYLSMAGKTKPFSILLLRKLLYKGEAKDSHRGFRTLYIGNACDYPTPQDMGIKSGEIVSQSVLPLVKQDKALFESFEEICKEIGNNNKFWESQLGATFSTDLKFLTGTNYKLHLSCAYDENALKEVATSKNLQNASMGYMGSQNQTIAKKFYNNVNAVSEVANELVQIAATYGFVGGGWTNDQASSPAVGPDLDAFVSIIMKLGAGGFEQRYGGFPLVMRKFTLLHDYIENELGVNLDYNNIK